MYLLISSCFSVNDIICLVKPLQTSTIWIIPDEDVIFYVCSRLTMNQKWNTFDNWVPKMVHNWCGPQCAKWSCPFLPPEQISVCYQCGPCWTNPWYLCVSVVCWARQSWTDWLPFIVPYLHHKWRESEHFVYMEEPKYMYFQFPSKFSILVFCLKKSSCASLFDTGFSPIWIATQLSCIYIILW